LLLKLLAEQEEVQRQEAARVVELDAAMAAKAAENALRTVEKHQAQELWLTRSMERAKGHQTNSGIGVPSTLEGSSKFFQLYNSHYTSRCILLCFYTLILSIQLPGHLFYNALPPFSPAMLHA
jgi:hypothetical protein